MSSSLSSFPEDAWNFDLPCWDATAEAIGEALLHERARVPPIVLGQCEATVDERRCPTQGLLTRARGRLLDDGGCEHGAPETFTVFLCPRHGATLERAVRRYPR